MADSAMIKVKQFPPVSTGYCPHLNVIGPDEQSSVVCADCGKTLRWAGGNVNVGDGNVNAVPSPADEKGRRSVR